MQLPYDPIFHFWAFIQRSLKHQLWRSSVKTLWFHCKGYGFYPWWELRSHMPCVGCGQKNKLMWRQFLAHSNCSVFITYRNPDDDTFQLIVVAAKHQNIEAKFYREYKLYHLEKRNLLYLHFLPWKVIAPTSHHFK